MAETIHLNPGNARAIIGPSTERAIARAKVAALNKTLSAITTQAKRYIAAKMNIKQQVVMQKLQQTKASAARPLAVLRISDLVGIPLVQFGAKEILVPTQRGLRRGVSVEVTVPMKVSVKGGLTIELQPGRQTVPGAFMGLMRSGKKGIFIRKGYGQNTARLPIQELRFRQLISTLAADSGLTDALVKRAHEVFPTAFDQAFRHFLDQELKAKAK